MCENWTARVLGGERIFCMSTFWMAAEYIIFSDGEQHLGCKWNLRESAGIYDCRDLQYLVTYLLNEASDFCSL